jgi:hypothetical protein
VYEARLIVETELTMFSYELRGKLPRYQPPRPKIGKIRQP